MRRPLLPPERDATNQRERERSRGIAKRESTRCAAETLLNQRMVDAIREMLGLAPLYAAEVPTSYAPMSGLSVERFRMAIPLTEPWHADALPVRRLRSRRAAMSEAIGRQVKRVRAGALP